MCIPLPTSSCSFHLLGCLQAICTKLVPHSFIYAGKPSRTLSLLYTLWLFSIVLMLDMSCLTWLKPKLSLPSYWQKAILEVSMWGEICQLFSTTLHQSKKKRESTIGCLLWGPGRSLQTWACFRLAKRLLLIWKALWERLRQICCHARSFIKFFFQVKAFCSLLLMRQESMQGSILSRKHLSWKWLHCCVWSDVFLCCFVFCCSHRIFDWIWCQWKICF